MTKRMRLVLAIASALAAVLFMAMYASGIASDKQSERELAMRRYGGETALVCVTSRDIAMGEVFTERNVELVEWLVDLLPEGALVDRSLLIGQTCSVNIPRNTPIVEMFMDQGRESLVVPEGLVAVGVPCTNEGSVGGALTPNAIVDVYVVSEGSAHVLAKNVPVLRFGGGSSTTSWATLALPADKVEAVIAASSMYRLHFALPSQSATLPSHEEE